MTTQQPVGIGYFDSTSEGPAFDEATVCPACGTPLADSSRPSMAVMVHCTRWPLGTFYRIHRDELPRITKDAYYELVCRALELRARLEKGRSSIPSSFLNAFKGDNPS
jgi:hypothetical protein